MRTQRVSEFPVPILYMHDYVLASCNETSLGQSAHTPKTASTVFLLILDRYELIIRFSSLSVRDLAPALRSLYMMI